MKNHTIYKIGNIFCLKISGRGECPPPPPSVSTPVRFGRWKYSVENEANPSLLNSTLFKVSEQKAISSILKYPNMWTKCSLNSVLEVTLMRFHLRYYILKCKNPSLIYHTGAYAGICPGRINKFVFIKGGGARAWHPLGPKDIVEIIDFTDPRGNYSPAIAPPPTHECTSFISYKPYHV